MFFKAKNYLSGNILLYIMEIFLPHFLSFSFSEPLQKGIMELAAVAIGSLCNLWFIYMKNICVCHIFFFLFVDRYRSTNFPLVLLVINWDVFVLSYARSKNQPVFTECQCSCCLHAVFFVAMCVGASGPGPESPFSCRALPVFLWRTVIFLDQGLLQIGVFFLVGLE